MVIAEVQKANQVNKTKTEFLFKESFSKTHSSSDDEHYDEEIGNLFEAHPERDKLLLSIIDTGVGITKSDQQKLFKLFGCLTSID